MNHSANLDAIKDQIARWEKGDEDGETTVIDVLTELYHFSDTHAVQMGDAIAVANRHFGAEKAER